MNLREKNENKKKKPDHVSFDSRQLLPKILIKKMYTSKIQKNRIKKYSNNKKPVA